MLPLPPDLLARVGTLPGYSAQALPAPTERLLRDLTQAFGEAEAYDLLLAVAYAQVYARDLATEAAEAAGHVIRVSKLLKNARAKAAAEAFVARLPDWELGVQALLAAAPAPVLSLPQADEEEWEQPPLQQLGNALFRLYLDVHWTLYCHLPDQERPVAEVFGRQLGAVLRRNVLGSANAANYVLTHTGAYHRALAGLVDEALGPYPALSRWQVLSWAHEAVHTGKPSGLKTFAKNIAQSAKNWPDEAFDYFLREVVLYTHDSTGPPDYRPVRQLAEAVVFRRQPDRRAVLEALHALGRTTPGATQLAALLREVKRPDSAEANAPAPPADALVFPDLVLRLGIVCELMYTQPLIQPKFDVREFAKTYTEREIDVEEEGYALIPEAVAFFEQLPLTPALLGQVKKLFFEFGKPDFGIRCQVLPFDDGEGDELQLSSLAGIEQCPNLETFGLTDLPPDFAPPSLAPLLRLPKLRQAHLDPALADDPAYQELARRGLLAAG